PASGVARLLGASSPLVRAGAAILSAPGDEAVAGVGETQDGAMRIHVRIHARVLRRDGTPAPASVAPTLLGRVPSDAAAAVRLTGGGQSAFRTLASGAFTLPVTPALQPSYAVSGDTLVVTTAQPGLDQARVAPRGVVQAAALRAVRGEDDGSVQALGYLDLRQ